LISFVFSACDRTSKIDDDNILKNEKATISTMSAEVSAIIIEKEFSDWQRAYADYFNSNLTNEYLSSVYIEDINNCGIPEVFFLYPTPSVTLIYYIKGSIQAIDFNLASMGTTIFFGYLKETNQILYVRARNGYEWFVYNWTDDGYEEKHTYINDSHYEGMNTHNEDGAFYINSEEVSEEEYEQLENEVINLLGNMIEFELFTNNNKENNQNGILGYIEEKLF